DDVLQYIKRYVDGYASRAGNRSTRLWGEDLDSVFHRAQGYAPIIIRSFNARGVPPAVGLYIVMIETEYHNIRSENSAGAAGLFQFIGPTARGYGVDPADRTDVDKMAPAAARYLAERIAEFGPDSMSVALAIAGYNRSPDSVRRDLQEVLNSENKERSFWTLVANSDKLDHWFQNENVKYVPKFFAAAIVGENPWAFGLSMNPLSTYSQAG
ncbi:MAG TPA: transglycosylase SLT domain-containing protein, partial [Blastocatellia bacterium]|nr:transglycosylase SLT domain-containing protein [Blastocatellia bacterium]